MGDSTQWIILDRDGVINVDSEDFIKSVDEWIPIEGSIEAIARLCRAGYRIVVVSNQSGLGRGLFDRDALEAMHTKMQNLVRQAGGSIEGVFYCPHHPEDNCECRKPQTGLFDEVESAFNIDLADAYAVGDSLRDLQAAIRKNCKPVLVLTGKGEKTRAQVDRLEQHQQVMVFNDLREFADNLINKSF